MPESKHAKDSQQKRRRLGADSTPMTSRRGGQQTTNKCQRPLISAEQWINNNLVKCGGRLSCQPGETVELDPHDVVEEVPSTSASTTLLVGISDLENDDVTIRLTTDSFGADVSSLNHDDADDTTDNLRAKIEETISSHCATTTESSPQVKEYSSGGITRDSEGETYSDNDLAKMLEMEFDRQFAKTSAELMANESDTNSDISHESSQSKEFESKDVGVDVTDRIQGMISSDENLSTNISYNRQQSPPSGHRPADGNNILQGWQQTSDDTQLLMKDVRFRKQHRRSSSLQLSRCMAFDLSTIPEESDGKRSDNTCSSLESLRFELRGTLPRAATLGTLYDNMAAEDKRLSYASSSTPKRRDIFRYENPPKEKDVEIRRSKEFGRTDHLTTKTTALERHTNSKPKVPAKPKKGHSNFKRFKDAKDHIIRKSVHKTRRQADAESKSQHHQPGGNEGGVKHTKTTKHDKESAAAHSKRKVFHTKKARDANSYRSYTTQTSSETETETARDADKSKKTIPGGHRTFSRYSSRGVELFKTLRERNTVNTKVDNNNIVKDHSGVKDAHIGCIEEIITYSATKSNCMEQCVVNDRLSPKTFGDEVNNVFVDGGHDDKTQKHGKLEHYDHVIENNYQEHEETVSVDAKTSGMQQDVIKKPVVTRCGSSESDYSINRETVNDADLSKESLLDDDNKELDLSPEKNGYFADTEIVDSSRLDERTDEEVLSAKTPLGNRNHVNLNHEYCAKIVVSDSPLPPHPRMNDAELEEENTMTITDGGIPSSDADFFLNSYSEKESELESSSLLEERTDITDDEDTSDVKTDIFSTSITSFTEDSCFCSSSTADSSSDKQSAESLDALSTPDNDWRRRSYRRRQQDGIISGEGGSWKEREARITSKIQWLRTEIVSEQNTIK